MPFILWYKPHALHRQWPVPSRLQSGVDIAPQFTHSRPSAKSSNKSDQKGDRSHRYAKCGNHSVLLSSIQPHRIIPQCSGMEAPAGDAGCISTSPTQQSGVSYLTAALQINLSWKQRWNTAPAVQFKTSITSLSPPFSDSSTSDKPNLQPLVYRTEHLPVPGTTYVEVTCWRCSPQIKFIPELI